MLTRVSLPAPPVSWALPCVGEADRHGGGGVGIADGVGARAAIERIVAMCHPTRCVGVAARVSLKAEPVRFSMPVRVSLPAPTVS